MEPNTPDKGTIEPVSLGFAARRLNVSVAWLREDVEAGRLPGVMAGRTALVHLPTINRVLAERAMQQHPEQGGEA